ncbi:MAG TPA: site-specific integrase [Elusimicrobiota bacterium]|nr:site-specific integrase [Elusimicrobiota bacterium]
MSVKLIDAQKRKYKVIVNFQYKRYKRIIVGSKRLAEEVEAKLKTQLAEGKLFPERGLKRISFEEIANRFMTEYACYKKSGNKIQIYITGAIQFYKGKLLNEINPPDVQRFREFLSQRMTPVSVNHYQRVLRRVFNWASEIGIFKGENPASGKKVKLENERKFWRTYFLQPDEVKKLVDVADSRIRPIIMTAVFTGIRKSELKKLKKADVNLSSRTLFIREGKNDEPGSVPIPGILSPALSEQVEQLEKQEQSLFNFKNFENLWEKAKTDAKLPKLHFHDLRHTYASYLAMKTGNLQIVQALLRHKDYRMTQRYAHLTPGYLMQAAEMLDTTFSDIKPAAIEKRKFVVKDALCDNSEVPNLVPVDKPKF